MLISEILNEKRLLIEEIFKDIKISLLYINQFLTIKAKCTRNCNQCLL